MPIALTNAQIRFLRGQAHDLKAMLQVGGKGISDALAAEVDGALEHHELIKVKVAAGGSRGARHDDRRRWPNAPMRRWCSASATPPCSTGPAKDKRQIVLPRA